MIHFACRCKHVFELPEEMGGQQIQCPDCMLLVDVPTRDELNELNEDGTFQVEAPPPGHDPHRFAELKRAFSKEHVDEDGMEYDLRNTPEQIAAAGTDDSALEYEIVPTAPKYDPETGELIRPLEVSAQPDAPPHPSQIPFAKSTLNYASPDMNPRFSMVGALVSMFMPINLAAMFFVLIAHVFLIMAMFSFILKFLVLAIVGMGLIAHYANVIEEIALEERDELPRFLRHFDLADDIWLPFCRVGAAAILCYWPATVLNLAAAIENWPPVRVGIAYLILSFLGAILFPATVLISTTSGSITNLRPDRVLGTIARIGPRYVFFVALFIAAVNVYSFGFSAAFTQFFDVFRTGPTVKWLLDGLIDYSILFAGIFLMHYLGWLLGLAYRRDHHSFPWVFQHRERMIPGVNAPRYTRPVPPGPPHEQKV